MPNNLESIWAKQIELQLLYLKAELPDEKAELLSCSALADRTLAMISAMCEEGFEARMTMPNRKTWGTVPKSEALQVAKAKGLKSELADTFLFWQAACYWAGFTLEEMLEAIAAKQIVNETRADHLINKAND